MVQTSNIDAARRLTQPCQTCEGVEKLYHLPHSKHDVHTDLKCQSRLYCDALRIYGYEHFFCFICKEPFPARDLLGFLGHFHTAHDSRFASYYAMPFKALIDRLQRIQRSCPEKFNDAIIDKDTVDVTRESLLLHGVDPTAAARVRTQARQPPTGISLPQQQFFAKATPGVTAHIVNDKLGVHPHQGFMGAYNAGICIAAQSMQDPVSRSMFY